MTVASSARSLWQRIETLHAVTYFAPESIDAAKTAGLRGFWMGYFGFRASPLGPVGPDLVGAVFANFAPDMVARALPDAWSYSTPEELVVARSHAAAAALRRRAPTIDDLAAEVDAALAEVIEMASPLGRPLFAANRATSAPDDPVARLWQQCTTLREHRGDGHVAALVGAGVDGCEAHLLLAADQDVDPQVFLAHRGWSEREVDAATARLDARRLLRDGRLTAAGSRLRADVEASTDRAAADPFDRSIGAAGVARLIEALTPVARAVADSGVLPFPNPMGLASVSSS